MSHDDHKTDDHEAGTDDHGTDDHEAGTNVRTGTKVRTEVLGQRHVDRANARATDFDRDFQRFITQTAWGGVWGREHLDRRTKSLITIAILAAQGHDELALHLRAARNTGATPEDIAEVFFHVAAYAGIPRANQAFQMAKKLFEDEADEGHD